MDIPLIIGIAIVMIIPAFVGAGALWEIFGSWAVEFIWVCIMAGLCLSIVRRLSGSNKYKS